MNFTALYAELVVVGSGTVIPILLLFYALFGDPSWLHKLQNLSSIQSAIFLVPVLSVIYLLGIVIANVSYKLFEDLEKKLRKDVLEESREKKKLNGATSKELQEDFQYETIRNTLYTSPDTKALIEDFEFRRSKVRICRGWFVNSVLISFALDTCFVTGKISFPVTCFWLITACLLMVGTRVSWEVATETELWWLTEYADQQERIRRASEAAQAKAQGGWICS